MAKKTKKAKKAALLHQLAIARLAIVLLGTGYGGYRLWQAFTDTPLEPLPLSSFAAFWLAIVALTFDGFFKGESK